MYNVVPAGCCSRSDRCSTMSAKKSPVYPPRIVNGSVFFPAINTVEKREKRITSKGNTYRTKGFRRFRFIMAL